MRVRYREFVFAPFEDDTPYVVGCIVEWGWEEGWSHIQFGCHFAPWLRPLPDYLCRQMEALKLGLDDLENGLGVYKGKGHWLEVKYKEGASKEELRRWFSNTYIWSPPVKYTPAVLVAPVRLVVYAPAERVPALALREKPESEVQTTEHTDSEASLQGRHRETRSGTKPPNI